ncbi:hypothetical protein C0J52_00810, partial [Blattella germanica]
PRKLTFWIIVKLILCAVRVYIINRVSLKTGKIVNRTLTVSYCLYFCLMFTEVFTAAQFCSFNILYRLSCDVTSHAYSSIG